MIYVSRREEIRENTLKTKVRREENKRQQLRCTLKKKRTERGKYMRQE